MAPRAQATTSPAPGPGEREPDGTRHPQPPESLLGGSAAAVGTAQCPLASHVAPGVHCVSFVQSARQAACSQRYGAQSVVVPSGPTRLWLSRQTVFTGD